MLPLTIALLCAGCEGCQTADETAETAAPPPPSAPPPPVVDVEPEVDAGDAQDAGEADAGQKKPATIFDPAGIRRCCDALEQNAKSAPPNLVGAYQAASATCRGIKASPQARQQIAALSTMLMGAGLPAACR